MRYITLSFAAVAYLFITSFTGKKSITVTSPAFAHNSAIPVKYTCVGQEFSPPLNITDIPPEAKSLVLIVDDPDATTKITRQKVCVPDKKTKGKYTKRNTKKTTAPPTHEVVETKICFTHWVVWNIDVNSGKIPENFKNQDEGLNDTKQQGYKGMCPPSGTHHYHFRVYALDTKLNIPRNSDKVALEKVMKGHIIASGELVGLFNKDYK